MLYKFDARLITILIKKYDNNYKNEELPYPIIFVRACVDSYWALGQLGPVQLGPGTVGPWDSLALGKFSPGQVESWDMF